MSEREIADRAKNMTYSIAVAGRRFRFVAVVDFLLNRAHAAMNSAI